MIKKPLLESRYFIGVFNQNMMTFYKGDSW